MLELREITKSYTIGENSQQVLKGISIKFRKNEFTSILGSSGSGKTTLLNIIGGLDKYDSGNLLIEGISTEKYKDRDWDSYRNYRVGFVFQSYNLIQHQSVVANVEMALTLSGVSKKERRERAEKALEKVGLQDHIHKRPNQLSGGQMQRVAIARALVNDPEIILADEPTGALDSQTSIQIMDILKEVAKEKLVIMVTHNPEIARNYSTRIIELKDGMIINDTNPFEEEIPENGAEKKIRKTSMSLRTSLGLSFNNLLTKKGRTFLTAFAGSIGIIGIALILSLSNGVSEYVKKTERDSLADYPISIEKNSYDYSKLFTSGNDEKIEVKEGKINSRDDITSQIDLFEDVIKKNHLKEFKQYLDSDKDILNNVTDIQYGYNLELQIYATSDDDYTKVNPNDYNILGATEDMSDDQTGFSLSSPGAQSVFYELLENDEVLNSKYEVLAGSLPSDYDEMVLIVDKDSTILDSVLYTLEMKDRNDAKQLLDKIIGTDKEKSESTEYDYEDFIGRSYQLILNTDYYKLENGAWIDYSNDSSYMKKIIADGLEVKIVGVLRAKEDATANVIGYRHSLTEYVINEISKTELYKEQTKNKEINVLTGKTFDGFTDTYEKNAKLLGIADLDDPDSINIYPRDFDAKEIVVSRIKEYNQKQKDSGNDELVISYTDLIKTMINGVTTIINMISYVLIGFVAISLVVSSIMIAIITYISVLERTKEIGILRAIGASKKDVIRVFRAETMIEGFIAGALGIIVAMILSSLTNVIVGHLAHVDKIAKMPVGGAIFLVVLSILLNVIAGHIPSKMASKKDPVVALRSE